MAHCASSLRAEELRSYCLDPVRAPGSAAPQVALPPAGGALDARPLARSLGSSWAAALAVAHRRSSRSRRPRHLPRHLPAHGGPWAARPAAAAPAGGHTSWRCAWIVRGRWSGYASSWCERVSGSQGGQARPEEAHRGRGSGSAGRRLEHLAGAHLDELYEAEVVVVHVFGGDAEGREQQQPPAGAGEHERSRATQRTCRAQGSSIGVLSGASRGPEAAKALLQDNLLGSSPGLG